MRHWNTLRAAMSARGAGPGPARYTRPRPAFVRTEAREARLKSGATAVGPHFSAARAWFLCQLSSQRRSTSAQAERSSMTTCSSIEWRPAPRGPNRHRRRPCCPEDCRIGPEAYTLDARFTEAGANRGRQALDDDRILGRRVGRSRQQQANICHESRIARRNLARDRLELTDRDINRLARKRASLHLEDRSRRINAQFRPAVNPPGVQGRHAEERVRRA